MKNTGISGIRLGRIGAALCAAACVTAQASLTASAAFDSSRLVIIETDRYSTVESGVDVLCSPSGILPAGEGRFLITDTEHGSVLSVEGKKAAVLAGSSLSDEFPVSAAMEALFEEPWAIAPFLEGYAVTDTDSHMIYYIGPDKIYTLGGQSMPGSANGFGEETSFCRPTGLTADKSGTLYIADTGNGLIRRMEPYGRVTAYLTNLSEPTGLCWKDGSLYIAETGANRILRAADGRIAEIIGTGEEGYLDGETGKAAFSAPQGVTVGDDGTIYIADTGNHAVRKVKGGAVSTILARDPSDLEQFPASPRGLAVVGKTLYVCDSFAKKVLAITYE